MENKRLVEVFVEYIDYFNNEQTFGVLFAGFMTRRNLYLKRISVIGNPVEDKVEFVSIRKKDTKHVDRNRVKSTSNPDQFREMKVDDRIGVLDPRLKKVSNNAIIAEIKSVVKDLSV